MLGFHVPNVTVVTRNEEALLPLIVEHRCAQKPPMCKQAGGPCALVQLLLVISIDNDLLGQCRLVHLAVRCDGHFVQGHDELRDGRRS
jgi:hypothetical protein